MVCVLADLWASLHIIVSRVRGYVGQKSGLGFSLRRILRDAVAAIGLDEKACLKYEASATEQEIVRGALEVADADEHVFCFFRAITNREELDSDIPLQRPERQDNEPLAEDFIDLVDPKGDRRPDKDARDQLENLKSSLDAKLHDNIRTYEARWQEGQISPDHLGSLPESLGDCLALLDDPEARGTLCLDVWRSMATTILRQLDQVERIDPLYAEIWSHEEFGGERSGHFTGREQPLARIAGYLAESEPGLFAILGEPGSGKSALMARALEEARAAHPDAVTLVRFIGATPASSDGRSLLDSLCRQISRAYGADESDIPIEYNDLAVEVEKRMKLADAERPLILFIDALDQLSGVGRSLSWLPGSLPEHVHVVLSTLAGDCEQALRLKDPAPRLVPLEAMSPEEGETLLSHWLEQAGRTLQEHQKKEVLVKFAGEGLPLYLRLAYEEALLWRSYADPRDTVLEGGIVALIRENLFARLAQPSNHGRAMVAHSLGYLAASRFGLSEDEIVDVLSIDEEVKRDFREHARRSPEIDRLPIVVWSRLFFDLEPYLTERAAGEGTLIGFYHPDLERVARSAYLAGADGVRAHEMLAEYFSAQEYWRESLEDQRRRAATLPPVPRPANVRKVEELPWHLLRIARHHGRWDEVESLLSDPSFLEAKVEAGLVFDLEEDLTEAIADLPPERSTTSIIALLQEAIRRDLLFLSNHPTSLFQVLWNSCWWYDCPGFADHYTVRRRTGQRERRRDHDQLMSAVVQRWRFQKHRRGVFFPWLRSRRPPRVSLHSGQVAVFPLHKRGVRDLAVVGPQQIASCSWDDTIRVWDLRSGEQLRTIHAPGCAGLAAWPEGRLLAGWSEGYLRIWQLGSASASIAIPCPPPADHGLAFTGEGRELVVGASDGSVRAYEVASHYQMWERSLPVETAAAMFFSPDGAFVAISDSSGGIAVFAVSPPALRWRRTDLGRAKCVAWSPDASSLAIGTNEGSVPIVDARTGADTGCLRDLATSAVQSVCFSADGRLVATGSSREGTSTYTYNLVGNVVDGTERVVCIEVWNAESSEEIVSFWGHEDAIMAVRFCGAGNLLASAGSDTTIRVWDLTADPDVQEIRDHEIWPIGAAFFTPDGRIAVSRSIGEEYTAIDTATGRAFFRWRQTQGGSPRESLALDRFVVEEGGNERAVRDASTGALIGWIPVRLRRWLVHQRLGLLAGYEEESKFLHLYSIEALMMPTEGTRDVDEAVMSFARLADILASEIIVTTSAAELMKRQAVASAEARYDAYAEALEDEIAVWERNGEADVVRYLRSALASGSSGS